MVEPRHLVNRPNVTTHSVMRCAPSQLMSDGGPGGPVGRVGETEWPGPVVCSGGDMSKFGTFSDPAAAHLACTRHSPALLLDALTRRLGASCRTDVHGAVLGSGMEMRPTSPTGMAPPPCYRQICYSTADFILRSMICSSVRPSSVRTMSVCSPWVGARCTCRGVSLNWTGLAARANSLLLVSVVRGK